MGENLIDEADARGFDIIETTSASNGYPQNLKYAVIGFDTFEEAEELAEEFGARVTTFNKRDGWNLWVRNSDTTLAPMENSSEDYGDNYNHYGLSDFESEEDFFEREVKDALENCYNIDDVESLIETYQEIWDELNKLKDDEIIITHEGRYYETIDRASMSFYHDTRHWVIGVILD